MSKSNLLVTAEFDDFDAYVEAIEDADVEMNISSLDFNRWTIRGIYLSDGMHVQAGSEGAGTVAFGVNPASGWNIFLHRDGLMRANGEEMLPGSAFVMPAGSEFFLSNDHAHRWFSIYVPESKGHDLGLNQDALGREYPSPRVVRRASPEFTLLCWKINRFLTSAAAGPEISESSHAVANFRNELFCTLRTCFGREWASPMSRRGRPIVTDRLMVARAIDAIEASTDGGLSIDELICVTGVSERSLRAGFRRYLGLSPKRFMQLHALNRARKRLSRARPEEITVTQVAADLGHWDVGRFAARYRSIFGESPSATLRGMS